jgi:pSer/pThr/pTyr-binding forkhead associated (FHA) protein
MTRSWVVGSAGDCDIVVESATVSGCHCRLTEDAGVFFLEDLGSTNGTFVNGQRIAAVTRVTPDDIITLGRVAGLPWPSQPGVRPWAEIRIGREPDNDLVVNNPAVSGYHARVVREAGSDAVYIEDLGSSNGTALNAPGQTITRAPLTPADTVYLGSHPVPAGEILGLLTAAKTPALLFRGQAMTIGRNAESDWIVDLPSISGRHARLTRSQGLILLEDLGSTNGTFVNGQRIDGAVAVAPGDRIGLGSHTFRLADDDAGETSGTDPRQITIDAEAASVLVPSVSLNSLVPDQVSNAGSDVPGGDRATSGSPAAHWTIADRVAAPWRIALLLLGAPVAAVAIVAVLQTSAGQAIPAGLFWLGLVAIGCGFCNALAGRPARGGVPPLRKPAATGPLLLLLLLQVLVLGGLCGLQCALTLVIVRSAIPLSGPGLATLGLLWLASAVGLLLGLTLARLVPPSRWALRLALVPVVLLLMWLLGGHWRTVAAMSPPVRVAASALPGRWAFEGLLLLESRDDLPGGTETARAIAEAYFPSETERMGVRADMFALASMLIGLAGAAAFLPPRD